MNNWDIALLYAINNGRDARFDSFFIAVTNSAAPVSILIPLIVLLWGYFKKDRHTLRQGTYLAVTFVSTVLIGTTVKWLVNKPRPFVTYPFIHKLSSGGSPSFPSGHTTDAFVTATAVTLIHPKWYIALPLYCWALLVAYSRMDLGVHYPSDVIAGIVLGTGMALLLNIHYNFTNGPSRFHL